MTRKPRNRWTGIVAGLVFFVFPGLPYFLLSLMGDRLCDTGDSVPPCTTSREMQDVVIFAMVVAVSILVGLFAHWIANRPKRAKAPPINAFD